MLPQARASQLLFAAIFTVTVFSLSSNETGPKVDLGYAVYMGVSRQGVDQYLGMRYATPPLGDLRFRAPREPLRETGIVQASSHGPICLPVQQPFTPPGTSAEDCLFIDVYKPTSPNFSKLPVMLWIQGGAFISNFNANYDGTGLIKASQGNVIVVTFNYRVGPYGFLASEDVRTDGDLNVGLLDQRRAMSWVQDHIGTFGGDPGRVTLFGTSSGAGSLLLHTLAYEGAPTSLFIAGIAPAQYEPEVLEVAELDFQYQQLLNATMCDSLKCLRSLSTEDLQSANVARPFPGQEVAPLFPYSPCIDGKLLSSRPSQLLASGKFASKPLLLGSSTDEGTIFAPGARSTAAISSFFHTQFPDLTTQDTDNVFAHYATVSQLPNHAPLFAEAAATYGDSTFICPGLSFASAFSQAGLPVYLFRDNILDPVNVALGLGVPHTWEVQAVWGPEYAVNHAAAPGANGYGNVNAAIVPVVQQYWISFARAQDPNIYRLEGSPKWTLSRSGERLKIQTNATMMETVGQEQVAHCLFWQGLQAKTHH